MNLIKRLLFSIFTERWEGYPLYRCLMLACVRHSSLHQKMKNQRQILDRISALPQETIDKILTHMPIRDALRTSILSKKWKYCWTSMPKLDFDDNLVNVSSDSYEIKKSKLVNAIFHVLLLHRAPILELRISLVCVEVDYEIDLIILHLSMSNKIKKFFFDGTHRYKLPCSFYKLQGLEHLDLTYCEFELPLMNKGFSTLKTLRLYTVSITSKMLQGFLTNCPLLEEFTWIEYDPIKFTECTFVELFKCLPSVQVLKITHFNIQHSNAGGMPHKLPTSLLHLRILALDVCFLELSSVLCVIDSSPNLEKIKLGMCYGHDQRCIPKAFKNSLDDEDYTGLNLDHLKEMEITRFHNHAPEMEFVNLIMAKSPLLEKARIELDSDVSVDNEVKMLRDLLKVPFPRASPTANFMIERPKKWVKM